GSSGAVDVAIDVGAGEGYDERPLGVMFAELHDRIGAAAGVQRDEGVARLTVVALRNRDAMAEFAKQARPSHCCHPVPVETSPRSWGNHRYAHVGGACGIILP